MKVELDFDDTEFENLKENILSAYGCRKKKLNNSEILKKGLSIY